MTFRIITIFALVSFFACSNDEERLDKRLYQETSATGGDATLGGDGSKYKVSNAPISRPICAFASKLTSGGLLLDIYLSETATCLPGNGYVPSFASEAIPPNTPVSVKAGCLAQDGKNESAELNISLTSANTEISKGRKSLTEYCSLASIQLKHLTANQEYCLQVNYTYADVFSNSEFETEKVCFRADSGLIPDFVFKPVSKDSEVATSLSSSTAE